MSALKYLKVLPEHIKESNSELTRFMEEYYTWLETNQVVFDYVKKEERTSIDDDEFLNYLRDEILVNFPELQIDEQLLLKHVKEFYISKGTENSILFLIKILFGLNGSIFLPSDNLFIPSAAKWKRESAIRFQIVSGTVGETFSVIAYTQDEDNVKHPIELVYIKNLHDDVYEAVIGNTATLVPGTLYADTFVATLIKTVSSKKISAPGVGFQVGDIFPITSASGSGTIIKVTRVTPSTGLRAFEIIRFGEGYLTDFTHVLYANTAIDVAAVNNLNITLDDGVTPVNLSYSSNDNVNKLNDNYQVSRFTYFQSLDYLANNNYVGQLIASGSTDVSGVNYTNVEAALIDFSLDYVFTYPGYYVSNEGVPSDTSYLQDGEYWQQFSYVIKSPLQYEQYKDIVKKLVHPAGLRMFGEYTIEQKLEVLISIQNFLSVFNSVLVDATLASDEITQKNVIKNIMYYNGTDWLPEPVNILEEIYKTLEKALPVDNQNVTDEVYKTFTKAVIDTQNLTDEIVQKVVTKNIAESHVVTEKLSFIFYKEILNLTPLELTVDGTNNLLINTTDILDGATYTPDSTSVEAKGGVLLNPYYTTSDLFTKLEPYWAFGYTQNERIIN